MEGSEESSEGGEDSEDDSGEDEPEEQGGAAEGTARLTARDLAAMLDDTAASDGDAASDPGAPSRPRRPQGPVEALVSTLAGCSTAAQCDAWCVQYARLDSKGNRRRLIRALGRPGPLTSPSLGSFGRAVASLSRVWPEIATSVGADVSRWCRRLSKVLDKSPRSVEPRVRAASYLGALVRFRVVAAGEAFRVMWALLQSFRLGNVDALCALLESCGRLLARQPETQPRLDAVISEVRQSPV